MGNAVAPTGITAGGPSVGVALRYPFSAARRRLGPVAILILVVMPTMAVVSAALGWWVLGVPLATAALIGAAVAPTDPVLASSVVTGELAERDLPARDREILSIESGANDGLALPLVLMAIAFAGPLTVGEATLESLWQVAGAVVLGAPLGWLGGRALKLGEEHGAAEHGPALLLIAVLALAILGMSGIARVDGILAVFVGGLVFNFVSTGRDRTMELSIDEAATGSLFSRSSYSSARRCSGQRGANSAGAESPSPWPSSASQASGGLSLGATARTGDAGRRVPSDGRVPRRVAPGHAFGVTPRSSRMSPDSCSSLCGHPRCGHLRPCWP